MYQIDVTTASQTLPAPSAAGTPGYFTDGDAKTPPTIVPADFMNMMMMEFLNVLMAVGIIPSKTTDNQVVTAIERIVEAKAGDYAVETGVANAYVVALSPAVTAYTAGLQVKFRAKHANTDACTLDAGGGVVPLLRDDGSALVKGDIGPNAIVTATYDTDAAGFLVAAIVPSQLGALAKLNIGALLTNDGNGNLAVRVSDPLGALSAIQVHDGNPNGAVAGNAGIAGTAAPSTCWDTANKIWWVCTTTGTAATGVWSRSVPGSAALANASSATGTVAAVSGAGAITPGQLAVFSEKNGTLEASGQSLSTINATTITSTETGTVIQPGTYAVDTTDGPVTLLLATTLAGLYTFLDPKNNWTTNNFTVSGNGNNIGNIPSNVAPTFIANVSDYQFSIVATNAYWRLV
ncbi:hypothetical protein [Telmatospirillum sp.]|uniref:hypothetical protein n=1 Tax=Telmatospirillum sp. TaxID=2079197 RepID=UPI002847956F|nr:hypothetical protein [Telmatospirillum sp.]MDR3438940.1 hypothetical protein [Telmatospirillum sp.]